MSLDLLKFKSYLREDQLAIFLFHGVVTTAERPVRNYTRKHIHRKEFEEFCRAFSDWGHPLALSDVPKLWSTGKPLTPYSFAITFDDGFANNYTVACPILERFNLPATFYVTTSFLNSHQPSWIDAIEIALENTEFSRLCLDFLGGEFSIRTDLEKRALLNSLRATLKTSTHIDPLEASAAICESLRVDVSAHLDEELDRKLEEEEVVAISSHSLFEVGGHSHTHRVLSNLSQELLEYEIAESIKILSSITGQPVFHYSYPEGQQESFNVGVVRVLKEAGIQVCPTAITGTNPVGSDLFALRRIAVV